MDAPSHNRLVQEAINDVNDQLQENAREDERDFREAIDLAEGRIREVRSASWFFPSFKTDLSIRLLKFEKQIESLKYIIADHEKTILKYRDLVRQLQVLTDRQPCHIARLTIQFKK